MELFQREWALTRPDPVIEIPHRVNVRKMKIRRVDVDMYGPTKGCP